jgi:hypothetical protein
MKYIAFLIESLLKAYTLLGRFKAGQPPEGHLLEVVVEARVSGTQSELVPEL